MRIPFSEYSLGHLKRGATVIVTLNSAANVRLMDSSNLNAYRNGRDHRYYKGGLVDHSPHRILVPRDGTWYLTVDVVGLRNAARSSLKVEPPRAPLTASSAVLPAPVLKRLRRAYYTARVPTFTAITEDSCRTFASTTSTRCAPRSATTSAPGATRSRSPRTCMAPPVGSETLL